MGERTVVGQYAINPEYKRKLTTEGHNGLLIAYCPLLINN